MNKPKPAYQETNLTAIRFYSKLAEDAFKSANDLRQRATFLNELAIQADMVGKGYTNYVEHMKKEFTK